MRSWLWCACCLLVLGLAVPAWGQAPTSWPAPAPAPDHEVPQVSPQPQVLEVELHSQHAGRQHVVFVLPPGYQENPQKQYPAVLAFAGLGESVRGQRAGAWGWVEKYGVVPVMAALSRGKLTREDLQGLVTEQELEGYNRALRQQPWRGVILVCPWPANVLRGQGLQRPGYEKFLIEELLPYTEQHLRVRPGAAGWGVDGISLGGLLSTHVGFKYPERFTAIGSQQGSVGSRAAHLERLARQNLEILRGRRLNVATSRQDPFLEKITRFHHRLEALQLPHRFTVLPGRHDKRFVRGPGSAELLLFQDRALWGSGEMPPPLAP